METKDLDYIVSNSKTLSEDTEPPEQLVDLAGFQVTRAELFAHTREPAVTIWPTRIKFNMACLRRFPHATHIQILIHPDQKRLIIRPSQPDAPDALRWARGGGEKELVNRDMLCKIFAGKIFDMMGWDHQYRYKILGNIAVCDGEVLFLFKLSEFELFVGGRGGKSFLVEDWRDYFGTPVSEHEDSFKIDLADGYITTEKI